MQNSEGIEAFREWALEHLRYRRFNTLDEYAASLNRPMDDGGWPSLNAACVDHGGKPVLRVDCVQCGQRYDVEQIDALPLFHCPSCRQETLPENLR